MKRRVAIALLAVALGRAQRPPEPGPSATEAAVAPPPSLCTISPTGLPALPSSVTLPALPQSCTAPVYPTPTSTPIKVNTSAGLQAALTKAACGAHIVLATGVTYQGNFIIPGTSCASNPILVESANISAFPQWTVVNGVATWSPPPSRSLAGSSAFPALASPNSAPTMDFSDNVAGWYFAGLEFTTTPTAQNVYPIIGMGEQTTSIAALPHNITFDRCLVHPAPCPASGLCNNVQRGLTLDAVNGSVILSNIWGIVATGMDSQGIMAYNTPGPLLIAYNEVEATGENIMFNTECPPSGYGPGVQGIPTCVVPSDVTIVHNHLIKQLAWRSLPAGCDPSKYQCYNVKNSFEIKHGQRMILDSNWFDTTFASGQLEFIIVNCYIQGPFVCGDLTVTNNLFEHGPQIAALTGNGNAQTGQRMLFRNNIGVDISGVNFGGRGIFMQVQNTAWLTVDHNTIVNQPPLGMGFNFSDEPPSTDLHFTYTNNIQYGPFFANGMGPGATLAALPKPTVADTALVGDYWPNLSELWKVYGTPIYPAEWNIYTPRSTATPATGQPGCSWNNKPILPCWPLDWAVVGFTDFNGGNAGTNLPGLVLGPSSPYRGRGTDSLDLGANVPDVVKAVNVTVPGRPAHLAPDK